MHEETDSQSTGCGKCGNAKWHFWKDCPARDAECRKCHKKGHFAKKCRSAKSVHDITQGYEDYEEEEIALFGRSVLKGRRRMDWSVAIELQLLQFQAALIPVKYMEH